MAEARVDDPAVDDTRVDAETTVLITGAGPAWARVTRLARPLFSDPSSAARAIGDAVVDAHPRDHHRVGFGADLLAVTGLVPAPLRDRLLRLAFT
jgi:hypothetical protein